jgi:anti-sigma-K factor RskA
MAVDTRGLPRLHHRSYQMWAVRNGRSTSVGVIEDLRSGKVMPIPAAGTVVAITVEPEGGSTQPTRQPIITMDPESV